MENKLILGDSLKVLETIENQSFSCCITDPPYSSGFVGKYYQVLKNYQESANLNKARSGNSWSWFGIPGYWSEQYYKTNQEYEDFTKKWMFEVNRILVSGSFFACFGCNKLINVNVNIANSCGFILKDILIWKYKSTFSKGYSLKRIDDSKSSNYKTMTACSYDPVMLFQKPIEGKNEENYKKYGTGFIDTGILKSNIIEISKPKKDERGDNPHYSVKPMQLMKILCSSLAIKNVLDPFVGSGTTCLAAKELNLDYLGIEFEEDFFNYARKRLDD